MKYEDIKHSNAQDGTTYRAQVSVYAVTAHAACPNRPLLTRDAAHAAGTSRHHVRTLGVRLHNCVA